MEIKLKEITVREVANGYQDSAENGVTGYGGRLNIRPAFQREFVYDEKERNAVLDTVIKGFPLNVMYWCAAGKDEEGNALYELLDGQQRTISLCQYVNGDFSLNNRYFHNLTAPEQAKILDYKLMIYICSGDDKEKLEWFRTINIAGVKLSDQELRNAIYSGPWVTHAKQHFSKIGCPAVGIGADKYLSGEMKRQEYLETAIEWIALANGIEGKNCVDQYMAIHQHDDHATDLWLHFQTVINWIKAVFPTWRKYMRGLEWGRLYLEHRNDNLNPAELEQQIRELMMDDDVTDKKGIYEYLLTGNEKHLNIRQFSDAQKQEAYERQNGICAMCGEHFEIGQMEGDHIDPWHSGGKTVAENCQMLCKPCNRRKSGR